MCKKIFRSVMSIFGGAPQMPTITYAPPPPPPPQLPVKTEKEKADEAKIKNAGLAGDERALSNETGTSGVTGSGFSLEPKRKPRGLLG